MDVRQFDDISQGSQQSLRHNRVHRGDLGETGRTNNDRYEESAVPVVAEDETLFKSAFRDFLQKFSPDKKMGDEDMGDIDNQSQPFYIQNIYKLMESDYTMGETEDENLMGTVHSFLVDLCHVLSHDEDLFKLIVACPADSMVYMDEVLAELLYMMEVSARAKVCLYNHPFVRNMRDLDPTDVETLIAIRGVIIRGSNIIPDMQVATFRCAAKISGAESQICGWEVCVPLANGEVQEPIECERCKSKYSMELFHNKCMFGNKQLLKIQETPESIPEGETPHTIMAYVYDELVDRAKPGDRCEVTGIFKATSVRVLPKQRNLKSVFRTYMDVNHIKKDSVNRLITNEDDLKGMGQGVKQMGADDKLIDTEEIESAAQVLKMFNEDTMTKLRDLGKDPDIYAKLAQSIAPNIWELADIKQGLLCQLFGACRKRMRTAGDTGKMSRSELHILLCGDPSTAKSQLLQYVHKLSPRGVYTAGRGTSAVGLTASITRDPETKEHVLESGAIVLSDRGICCIDEFDKMSDAAKTILHEAMEQQTVSVAKAGIVCSLNARTSILASANPINSRYDRKRSVVENINLPPSLLSRFDLIYLMLDNADAQADSNLAWHLCNLYGPSSKEAKRPPIDRATLAQYISFARTVCHPKLTRETSAELVNTYLKFRGRGGSGKSVSATPRQLESLIRLCEAIARMKLAEEVVVEDVREAARLIECATYSAIVDPTTGRIDFDQLNMGVGEGQRVRRETIMTAVVNCLRTNELETTKEMLVKKVDDVLIQAGLKTLDVMRKELDLLLKEMETQGSIGKTHTGKYISHT